MQLVFTCYLTYRTMQGRRFFSCLIIYLTIQSAPRLWLWRASDCKHWSIAKSMVIVHPVAYSCLKYGVFIKTWSYAIQRGSYMVWKINTGVCPRLEFNNIMFYNCLEYDFYIYGAFELLCNSIANLWRHVWYHYNTLGYPVIIISKIIDISCNGRRNA